jgi:hypothetical protein
LSKQYLYLLTVRKIADSPRKRGEVSEPYSSRLHLPQRREQLHPQQRDRDGADAAEHAAGTVPNSAAVTPLSNWPSWLRH